MRRGLVRVMGTPAGVLEETASGYQFTYDPACLASPDARPVSLTLPLRSKPYESAHLFAFFEGLLSEGTLRDLQCSRFKIDASDSFGLLLKTAASDVIGCVTVESLPEEEEQS